MRLIFLLISAVTIGMLAVLWLKLFSPSLNSLYSPNQLPDSVSNPALQIDTHAPKTPQQLLESSTQKTEIYQQQVQDYQDQVINQINQTPQ